MESPISVTIVDRVVPEQDGSDNSQCIKDIVLEVMVNNGWSQDANLELTSVALGMTNRLYKCENLDKPDTLYPAVIVRIYGKGSSALIDREREYKIQQLVGQAGIGPSVLGRFKNGLVVQFVTGECLRPNLVRGAHISRKIAKNMAIFHRKVLLEEEVQFWNTIRSWFAIVEKHRSDFVLSDPRLDREITLQDIKDEIDWLEERFKSMNYPVFCCHNDCNSENIIHDSEEGKLTFIDLEYCYNNYRGFDIGNHFCEWAGVALNSDFDTYYPRAQEQKPFLQSYLAAYLDKTEADVTDKELEDLFHECNEGAQLSHLHWGLWGLVQDDISDLDYDFYDYATNRLKQYFFRQKVQNEPGELGWLALESSRELFEESPVDHSSPKPVSH